MIGTLQGPWLLGAGLFLLILAIRRSSHAAPSWPVVALVAVLAVFAAATRFALGIWGPLHVNGQGPLWIRGALEPSALSGYGPGYSELFGWATWFGTRADRAIFTANVVLSGLSPVLLFAVARLLGVAWGGALGAALVLAADPVAVRTAASEGYFTALIALVLAVQLALAVGIRDDSGDKLARTLAFIAAGLIAASVARIHPMSYLPLAFCPLVALQRGQPDAWAPRLRLAGLATLAIGGIVLTTSGGTILHALRASPMTSQAAAGVARSEVLVVLGVTLLVIVLQRWLRSAGLPILGLCSLAAVVATHNAFQQSPLWHLCYQRVFCAGMLLGVAALVPRGAPGIVLGVSSAAATTFLLLDAARPYVDTATTEQMEYRFLQESLAQVPPGCTLAAINQSGMRIWEIPSYLLPESSGQRAVLQPSDLGAAPTDCLLYVRSSLCGSVEARPTCEAIERDALLTRGASRAFPALPSYVGLPYDRDPVEVAIFRVTAHAIGVNDGAAITPAFAERLYDRLKGLRAADGCAVGRLDTSRFRITIGLQAPGGGERTVEAATGGDSANEAGGWNLVVNDEGRRDCGATVAALQGILRDLGQPGRDE